MSTKTKTTTKEIHDKVDLLCTSLRKQYHNDGYVEGYGEGYQEGVNEVVEGGRAVKHWITRVNDGENFWNSDKYSVWGISDTVHSIVENSVQSGDIIWFVKNKPSGGNIVAFATFQKEIHRGDGSKIGELTNADFKWEETGWISNYLLKYKSRVNVEIEEMIRLDMMGASCIRQSTAERTASMLLRMNVDLDEIYQKYA